MQIAVAMPDQRDRGVLAEQIRTYGTRRHVELQVNELSGLGQTLTEDWCGYDIVFLTVCAQGQDSFWVAEAFRRVDECAGLVLIADTDKRALSGYELHALGYLLWPTSQQSIDRTLEQALSRVERQRKRRVPLPLQGYTRCCDGNAILYMRQEADRVRVQTSERSFLASCSLDGLRRTGHGNPFVPVSDACLVNLSYVRQTGKDWVQLGCGDNWHIILSLSGEYRASFTEALMALYQDGVRNTVLHTLRLLEFWGTV
ncbi:MAG: hypothetical protein LUC30_02070 [Clostridiales bacterium]|nr:hypothetical protein [Clostridiales bacterium]